MFDNLRDQANVAPNADDDPKFTQSSGSGSRKSEQPGHFLGMTPEQRFFVAFILMIMVIILGTLCLLVTGRISLI